MLLAAALACGCADPGAPAAPAPPRPALHRVKVGPAEASVAVAATPEERARGLMGRADLAPDEGMLFIFPSPARQSFWMKDTPAALSIAFVTPDGRIAEIQHMAPGSLERHVSESEALMALEMPAGWFDRKGVKPGDRIIVPQDAMPAAVR
jgi:hypothetical protein